MEENKIDILLSVDSIKEEFEEIFKAVKRDNPKFIKLTFEIEK